MARALERKTSLTGGGIGGSSKFSASKRATAKRMSSVNKMDNAVSAVKSAKIGATKKQAARPAVSTTNRSPIKKKIY